MNRKELDEAILNAIHILTSQKRKLLPSTSKKSPK